MCLLMKKFRFFVTFVCLLFQEHCSIHPLSLLYSVYNFTHCVLIFVMPKCRGRQFLWVLPNTRYASHCFAEKQFCREFLYFRNKIIQTQNDWVYKNDKYEVSVKCAWMWKIKNMSVAPSRSNISSFWKTIQSMTKTSFEHLTQLSLFLAMEAKWVAVSLFSDQSAASSASKLLGLSGRVSRPPSFGMPVDFAHPAPPVLGEKLIWASWGEENYQFVE